MPPRYVIVEDREGKAGGLTLRGAALELWKCKAPEVVIAGPAETGKTVAALHRLDAFLWRYSGAQGVLARKVRDTIYPTVLQTYVRRILLPGSPVKPYGGERPAWYDYPNGSRLWLAGLDDPGKALSSERDIIYVNQCEELDDDDWQVMTTRTTGRAGNAPYGQCMGDANPGPPGHWIRKRQEAGSLRLLTSRHEDNPSLWDGTGWTEQGKRTMAALDALTGVRHKRLRLGLWVQADGQVYDGWDASVHLIDPFPVPREWPRYWSLDFGYTDPFVCQMWATDPDGRLYLYREIYLTGRLVEDHARRALQLCAVPYKNGVPNWAAAVDPRPRAIVRDHQREDGLTFDRHTGITSIPAEKDIASGIQAVASRLKVQPDGKPRLYVMRRALDERDARLLEAKKPTCTAEEPEGYVWDERGGRRKGEQPVDKDNHGMDAMRYMMKYLDGSGGPIRW